MAKDKFDKAFEDMKAGRIKGPTNDDMSPRQKETLMTKQDIARNQMAAENKDKYLKNYGKGLSDELDTYKTSGKLLEASKSHPWGQGIQEMSDAIRAERTRAGLPTDGMKKGFGIILGFFVFFTDFKHISTNWTSYLNEFVLEEKKE